MCQSVSRHMDRVTATARAKNSHDEQRYRAFHGRMIELPINNPTQCLELEEVCDLWYMEFCYSQRHYLAAGCVFDIDIEGNRKHSVRAATVSMNMEALLRLLEPEIELVKEALEGLPYRIYASGGKGLHVYCKNPKGFISSPDPNRFSSAVVKSFLDSTFTENDFLSVIDTSFYPHNKGIRPYCCPHPSTKITPFFICTSENWDEDETFMEWVRSFLIRYGDAQATPVEDLEINLAIPRSAPTPRPSRRSENTVPGPIVCNTIEIGAFLCGLTIDEWISERSGGHKKRCESGTRKKRYLYYSAEGSVNTWCPIYGQVHTSNCCSWIVFENGVALATCFDYLCAGKIFVLRPDIEKPITYPKLVPESVITVLPECSTPYLDTRKVLEALSVHKKLVLTAPMGSGKTEAMVQFIRDLPPNARVLIVGTRRQQTRAWWNVFRTLGFELYDDKEGNLCEVNRLLVCLNSLLRVLDSPDVNGICKIIPYDLLVLDEADSLASWLGGCLLENNSAIFQCLKLLLKTSTYTICMDGLPTEVLSVMLQQLGVMEEFHWLVYNSFRFREVLVCNQTSYFTKCFTEALAANKNIFFVSNSKTVVMRFQDFCYHLGIEKSKVLAIHGSMSEDERIQGGNPDDWTRYRVVLANSSLGPGASFNPAIAPRHFSTVFCLVKVSQGAIPSHVMQLIYRVRHPKDNKIVVMVLRKTTNEKQLAATPEKIFADRVKTIGHYSQSVANVLAPGRELQKRKASEYRLQKETERYAALGKTIPPNKKRALQYTPTIVAIPAEEDGRLVAIPRQCTFGLRFGSMDLEYLAAKVASDSLLWSADSEKFLKSFLELLHLSGVGYTTVGERSVLDDEGKDIVLASHYGYLDKIKKMAAHDESMQLDNDYFLLKIKDLVPAEVFSKTRKRVSENTVPGMDSSLLRFYKIVCYYDSTSESVERTIENDVQRMFEDTIEPIPPLTINQFRPISNPRGPALNNRETPGELVTCFHNILLLMGKKWDPETRTIKPDEAYSTKCYIDSPIEEKQRFWSEVRTLTKLAVRQNSNFGYNSKLGVGILLETELVPAHPKDHKLLFALLYRLFSWIGFPVSKKTKRYKVGTSKHCYHLVSFDYDYVQMCKALVGLNSEGQKTTLLEALDCYFKHQNQ